MRTALILLALTLSACGRSDSDATAGGVTPDEARQLNEAALATDINSSANVMDDAK